MLDVIPFQFNAAVQIARPVHCDAIVFFDAIDEVSGMFFSNIFHPKIINYQCEGDWSRHVLPQARCVRAFVVSVGEEALAKEFVSQSTRLW